MRNNTYLMSDPDLIYPNQLVVGDIWINSRTYETSQWNGYYWVRVRSQNHEEEDD